MQLKLSELIKMADAMKAVVELPVGEAPDHKQWKELMRSYCYLHAELLCMEDKVEVFDDAA